MNDDQQRPEIKQFSLSVLTENTSGLLNRITIIFTRRKINIESLNVSETEIEGISRFTILIKSTYDQAEKVVKQIRKIIEVFGAFLYEIDQTHYQELALYKVPTEAFLGGNTIEELVRLNGARILEVERDYILIEKTGHRQDIQELLEKLRPFGILEFVRSARIAISKSKRKTQTFLDEIEAASSRTLFDN